MNANRYSYDMQHSKLTPCFVGLLAAQGFPGVTSFTVEMPEGCDSVHFFPVKVNPELLPHEVRSISLVLSLERAACSIDHGCYLVRFDRAVALVPD